MHFLRTFVFSAVLWASSAFAVTIPVGGCGGDAIEINIKMQHEQPIPKGAGEVGVSEKLVFR